ncbi:hypothetical protein GIB67_002578 [Kingdonia uniflora]|uniref:Protein kinase domain-containing protein n=1 Tax=Kingdonia uniflora TaxID=39325 RepID=A0A7J7N4N8_9MAGN|nr:hypothetical protein GIB67_002578 [Kingdonia uniflora]
MGGSWNPLGFQLQMVFRLFVFLGFSPIRRCWSLNLEGLALLEFQASVNTDPFGAFTSWNPDDDDPCMWSGVHCVDGSVQMLDLKGLFLGGVLSSKLAKLSNLRSLVLYGNNFSGFIPKEIGGLIKLELLDLRDNNLSGTIPAELGQMLSLQRLLLCNNNFWGSVPLELGKLDMLLEIQYDNNLTFSVPTGMGCLNRKLGHCIWESSMKQLDNADSFRILIKEKLLHYLDVSPLFRFIKASSNSVEKCCSNLLSSHEPYMVQNIESEVNFARRKLLQESTNLPAAPASKSAHFEPISVPYTRSSGAFPAIPNGKKVSSSPPLLTSLPDPPLQQAASNTNEQKSLVDGSTEKRWKYVYVVPGMAFVLTIAAGMLLMCRRRGVKTIGPWKTGISGQLQKAFITGKFYIYESKSILHIDKTAHKEVNFALFGSIGVPKLNRPELETACEDFSNIIGMYKHCTLFKGTLSSGVEIGVASTIIASSKDWSKNSEVAFRKKIDELSRVNHKNFVNLLGYCEENEPFLRMMVFEYAPNGTLFEHLHVKGFDHLDWNSRMRIIMGIAYCLQYMHHELNPPVSHFDLQSNAVYLTDDYAAKIAEIQFWEDFSAKSKKSGEAGSEHSELPPFADPETNVYCFGILLLEIISGKLPSSNAKESSLVNWAADYFNGKQCKSNILDPTLKAFKNNELEIICEIIQDCVQEDFRQRSSMREITLKLREVISISPDAATPRLSPLWWAELEILSVEAT